MIDIAKAPSRYHQLIEKIFFDHYSKGMLEIPFERKALKEAAQKLGIALPDNLGDVIYSIRFRTPMPTNVLATQPKGREWVIELIGRAKYRFRLVAINRIVPNPNLAVIRIPDNTPEIISAYALDDEQALLAKVRYNRLIDIFLGLTTFSLQNHLRTSAKGIGQIEIDELYVGLDKYGCHYVIPVQAKSGRDQISSVQAAQDMAWCAQKYPSLRCLAISAQFVSSDQIALFLLKVENDGIKVVEERQYRLVPCRELDAQEIAGYRA
ncbi:MAG: hypothetical protein LBU76_11030 [Azoarcus sp.]|jgi:hypothetical protein|nr:hypothetical protein [Azoarcus sp.]